MLVVERDQDAYVIDVGAEGGDVALALKHVKESPDLSSLVPARRLATLTTMESSGTVTATQAKTIVEAMIGGDHERDPEAIASALGFEAMDTSELESMVDEAIASQPDAWEKFCAGEGKAMGALVGAVMKASKGQADGKAVTALLNSKKQ